MRLNLWCCRRPWFLSAALSVLAFCSTAPAAPDLPDDPRRHTLLLFKARPQVLRVADLDSGIDSATISDVEIADLNGDGRNEIIVAWYATDYDAFARSLRHLTVFAGQGVNYTRVANINLFMPNKSVPSLSVFYRGTGDAALGDFDGDGDLDIAVGPYTGDEIWFLENRGNFNFTPQLKYMCGFNSAALETPPALRAADFNGDGRAELAYLVDHVFYMDGEVLHFWGTSSTVSAMSRLDWGTWGGGEYSLYSTWAMDVADMDGDGRPDLAFSGTADGGGVYPIFISWYQMNPANGYFSWMDKTPSFYCSDVIAVRPNPSCPAGLVLTDPNGSAIEYWRATCGGPMGFTHVGSLSGYAGYSNGLGMGGRVADLDGDGQPELVTKQKRATAQDGNQIEITYCRNDGATWIRVDPTPLNTMGFQTQQSNLSMRPKNLAVGDLFGNALPEIVAGFAASTIAENGQDLSTLRVAIWANSCVGDVNRDCYTDCYDLSDLMAALGTCRDQPAYNPNADVDKSGCVDNGDLEIVLRDVGCYCWATGAEWAGDLNCDGVVDEADLDPFVLALSDPQSYCDAFPHCPRLNADCNHDGQVDQCDIPWFERLIRR